jgi:2-oxoglutarate ferredoxin oxidoreductase subunit alpha
VDGNEAVARGAMAAGCRFFAGYPITPASQILMLLMDELPRMGGIAVQGEDEIASIGMCIGASLAGQKVLTATSGPGLALYAENIGLAIMLEAPLVIVDCQRHGPSTGSATKTGQGDIQFVRWGHSGGYPIIAVAPASVAECYSMTAEAFNLAETYRTPVFVLLDKELSLSRETVDLEAIPLPPAVYRTLAEGDAAPYCFEESGDVPPFVPLDGSRMVRYTGSSHDEQGELCGIPGVLGRYTRHLVDKIESHTDEFARTEADLDEGASILLVSYGITSRAAREAVARARAGGIRLSHLVLKTLWPVPARAIREAAAGMERILVPENNWGLYRREIERVLPRPSLDGIQKADTTLITPDEILKDIEDAASPRPRRSAGGKE